MGCKHILYQYHKPVVTGWLLSLQGQIFTPDALCDAAPKGFPSPPRTEPFISCLLGACVNHYTMEPLTKTTYMFK